MVVVGLAVRFLWGAQDPAMRTWGLVAAAPLMGAFAYFQAAARPRHVALGMMTLGLGAMVFWIVMLVIGGMPATGPIDFLFIAFILALPVAAIILGWLQLRRTPRQSLDGRTTQEVS
jgi:hypothetical protein